MNDKDKIKISDDCIVKLEGKLNQIKEICEQLLDSPYSRSEAESILEIIEGTDDE